MWKIVSFTTIILVFVLIYSTTGSDDDVTTRANALETNLLELIENIRLRMHIENPTVGLPVLDPFYLENQTDLEIAHPDFGYVSGYVSQLNVVGLQKLKVNEVKFTPVGFFFTFNFTLPEIDLSANYNIDGELGQLFPINGDGHLNIVLKNIGLWANGKLGFIDAHFYMNTLQLKFDVDSIFFDIEGLYGGGKNQYEVFVNKALNALAVDVLYELWPELEPDIIAFASEMADEFFQGYTSVELLDLMNGGLVFPPLPKE